MDKVYEKKIYLTVEAICKGTPEEFSTLFTKIQALQFDEKPNY